jgi:hypothetical protein
MVLAIVLVGFARTFYLRAWFDVPAMPRGAWLHGALLTAWFVGAMLQAVWVATRRIRLHRRAGWVLALVGVGLVWSSLSLALAAAADMERRIPLLLSRGMPQDQILELAATVFWVAAIAAFSFAVLVACAVLMRGSPELHKRLMLLASISIIQPALARIFRDWPVFGEFVNGQFLLVAVPVALLLLIPLVVYDLATRRSIHPATLYGSLFVAGLKLFGIFVLAKTTLGQAVISF